MLYDSVLVFINYVLRLRKLQIVVLLLLLLLLLSSSSSSSNSLLQSSLVGSPKSTRLADQALLIRCSAKSFLTVQ